MDRSRSTRPDTSGARAARASGRDAGEAPASVAIQWISAATPCEKRQVPSRRVRGRWPKRESRSLRLVAEEVRPTTRPLDAAERALLDHLLTPEFTGVETLRAQAAQAEVVDQDDRWCIELYVPPDTPPATNVYRNPVTQTGSASGTRPGADITLWLDGDYLDHIEVMWMEEPWPDLPSPSQLVPAAVM